MAMRLTFHYAASAKIALSFLISIWLLFAATALAVQQDNSAPPSLDKLRRLAESQHEIVMILLQKKEFPQAAAEASKIFEMNWPSSQEPILVKELLRITDQFLHLDQAATAVRLLDDNMKNFKAPASRAALWKEKGYLFKSMNQNDKALECFREAQRLEK
jgi:tetratricopeptide (TPR) repeat protein